MRITKLPAHICMKTHHISEISFFLICLALISFARIYIHMIILVRVKIKLMRARELEFRILSGNLCGTRKFLLYSGLVPRFRGRIYQSNELARTTAPLLLCVCFVDRRKCSYVIPRVLSLGDGKFFFFIYTGRYASSSFPLMRRRKIYLYSCFFKCVHDR